MTRLFLAAAALSFGLAPALADRADDIDTLYSALGLPQMVEIMRSEGIDYGADLRDQMFPDRGGSAWSAIVESIYDTAGMGTTVRSALDRSLGDEDLDPLIEFFTSERGQRIIGLEISARRAMLDDTVEEAAEENLTESRAAGDPRLDLITKFVDANDLVASNVMGAMNSNYAFYLGLAESDVFDMKLSESDILADVWAQEEQIREETENWVFSYLLLAYKPLENLDLEAYIALSETESGQRLNRALFAGFDEMFEDISHALGIAAAKFLAGEDI